MNIAELFVSLGIKGSDKTLNQLKGVKEGLSGVRDVSFETKAAIVGAFYALERMMTASGHLGVNLTNFNALTGLSTKQLQQWQYAAQQAGVGADEVAGSLKAVQSQMTNMLLGKGQPEGFGLLARNVGFDMKRVRDTFYVMEKLNELAQKLKGTPELFTNIGRSFGVSEGVLAAMLRGKFKPEILARAPIVNEGELKQLDKISVAWSNLWTKVQRQFDHFNAQFGGMFIKNIDAIVSKLIILVTELVKLAEKLKVFESLNFIMEKTAAGIGAINKNLAESEKPFDKEAFDKMSGKEQKEFFDKKFGKSWGEIVQDKMVEWAKEKFNTTKIATPVLKPNSVNRSPQSVQINQNLNFQHEGKDHAQTASSVNHGVKQAFRQLSAQSQGS